MSSVRIGLVGAGAIARQHLNVISDVVGLEVVGITSRTKEKAEELCGMYGAGLCCESVKELVRNAKPNALMILVSVGQMYEVAASILPYGLPVFIEKPAGLTPEENAGLAELATKYSVRTMVGLNRRYYSVFHKGLEIIREHGPLLGVVVEGHERFWRIREHGKFPDDVLNNWIFANSIHTIDLLRFFGGEVSEFSSLAQALYEKRGDQFAAAMAFENGGLGQYSAHWYSPGGWRVALYGDGVSVEFKPLEQGTWTDKDFAVHPIEPDPVDVEHKPGFFKQMEAFRDMVRDGDTSWPLQDLEGAHKTMVLAEQLTTNVIDRRNLQEDQEKRS